MGKKSVPVVINCLRCDKEIHTTEYKVSKGEGKYCSKKCHDEAQSNAIHKNCSTCNKPIDVIPSKNRIDNFCSQECSRKFFVEKRRKATPRKNCEMCNKEYKVQKAQLEKSRFCSKQCLQDWQKVNFKGAGSSKYVERETIKCDWCKKDIKRLPSDIAANKNNFCSILCKDAYHKNIFMKQPEVIEQNRNRALKNLENQIFDINSDIQILINDTLDSLNIKYQNEFIAGHFSFDNYLLEYGLFIEVMGQFWHCDSRKYNEINYKNQIDRIISDKSKRTYIRNKLNKNILYLWEYDIKNNIEMCKQLILQYINNNGILSKYHSSSYNFVNGLLTTPNKKQKQYMDIPINKLNEIINLKVKEKRSQYQPEKHITFNCDNCGSETEQLLVQYTKSDKHFCGKECKNVFFGHGIRHKHICSNCASEVLVVEHRHKDIIENNRNIFCNRKCQGEWMRKNNTRSVTLIEKECNNCQKSFSVKKYRKDKAKFCSRECADNYQKSSKIEVHCTWCNTSFKKSPSKISDNNFCSNACVGKFNGEKRRNRIKKKCVVCSNEFETIPSRKETHITCSVKCQGKWQSQTLIGENANNYQGKGKSKYL
jgi:hypothetical protein